MLYRKYDILPEKKESRILLFLLVLSVVIFCSCTVSASMIFKNGQPVQVLFTDGQGNTLENLTMSAALGETITLPYVPGHENAALSGWKLDSSVADANAVLLSAGSTLSLAISDDLMDYIDENGQLRLYAVNGHDPYTVVLYNNSGTNKLETYTVKYGSKFTIPDYVRSGYRALGWAKTKNAAAPAYSVGKTITVNRNLVFYLVCYKTSVVRTITYCSSKGGTNSKFQALKTTVKYGTKVKLASLPANDAYYSLGWSRTKGASTAAYKAGQTVTLRGNVTLYAVYQKRPSCSITFANNSGNSAGTAYKALAVKIYKGRKVTLPQVPAVKGYTALGWALSAKQTKAKYKADDQVAITSDTTFYAVYKKTIYYTVTFRSMNGKTNSTFKSLTIKTAAGTKISLPDLPASANNAPLGWALSANQSQAKYAVGKSITVNRNLIFYAVYTGAYTVTLHKNDGTVWKTVTVKEWAEYTFPSVVSASGYTMLGWSYSPHQSVAPEFEAGETITVNSNCNFYAVVFNRQTEPDLTSLQMPSLDSSDYDQVIFAGDSRTVRMGKTLQRMDDSSFLSKVHFIAMGGQGLSWLKSTGYEQLLDLLSSDKKTAVIFNFGVNDLANASAYVSYYNRIASTLKQEGADLYLMSVNPVSYANRVSASRVPREEADVRNFNAVLRAGLAGNYTYIDTYEYLMQTGFGYDAGSEGLDTGEDDGLHFTTKTYKRIFAYCLEFLLKN